MIMLIELWGYCGEDGDEDGGDEKGEDEKKA